MALVPCRECGQQVSTEAKTCPHCGVADPAGKPTPARPPSATPAPTGSSAVEKGCLGCLGLFIVLVIIGSLGKSSGSGGSSSSILDLNARVQFDGTQFHINNLNSFSWTDCKIEVNDDYEYHADRIPGGTETTIGAMRFTKSDGERFNPFAKAAKKMFIWCHQPDGKNASWGGRWSD